MSNFTIIVEDIKHHQRTIWINSLWTYAQLHNNLVQMYKNSEFKVVFKNKYLGLDTYGSWTLESITFANNSLIYIIKDPKLMQIKVEHINGQKHEMQVNSLWTYAQLHNQLVQMFENIQFNVIFGNKYLSVGTQGTATLKQLKFTNDCLIRVLPIMKGC